MTELTDAIDAVVSEALAHNGNVPIVPILRLKQARASIQAMSSESACALLHELAQLNLGMGANNTGPIPENVTRNEKRIIVALLTPLLGRPPFGHEIQAAMAM